MVHLVGGQSVARPALFLFTVRHYEHLMTAICDKIPGRVFGRDQITCAELFYGCVYGQAASGSCFD